MTLWSAEEMRRRTEMNTVKSMLRRFRWSEGPLEVGLEATNVTHVSKNLHAACQ
jgi:hypothetical protein